MKNERLDRLNKPYKIFAEVLEDAALDQFVETMEQDYIVKGALMPDAHLGYTLPIGGVVAADGVIVPSYVGYDIGCGMSAIRTEFHREEVVNIANIIRDQIYRDVPIGFKRHDVDQLLSFSGLMTSEAKEIFKKKDGLKQIGTLGSGNHFIEVGYDEEARVWIIVHSGSRGVGHGIAEHYMKLASGTDKAKEGHFGFRTDSDMGNDYINDMNFALSFALENRKQMVYNVLGIIEKALTQSSTWDNFINRNHNHAEYKDGLWIHRKGATHAEDGMRGVIPGNMRDGSFIVTGKGNEDSLNSSSHGAGRILGRAAAKRELNVDDFQETMKGISCRASEHTLDESPDAYKDIFEVMRLQADLVEVTNRVTPIINIKDDTPDRKWLKKNRKKKEK